MRAALVERGTDLAFEGYDALLQSYRSLGWEERIIGVTELNTPIVSYWIKGDRPWAKKYPTVLVAAGAHAEEAAGVIAALRLAQSPRFGGDLVIVPCRDPLGWDGVRHTFRRAAGNWDIPLETHDEAKRAFVTYGEILHDSDGFVVGVLNNLAFCSFHPSHAANHDTGEWVQKHLGDFPHLVSALKGRRLLVPGSPGLAFGRDVYGWGGGPTVYVDEDGRVGNFNRFFSIDSPPIEVASLRELADEVRPVYSFDLHENFGDKFGMYTNPLRFGDHREVYEAMIDAVQAQGFPIMPLAELLPFLDIPEGALLELYPGVYSANAEERVPPDAFGLYVRRFGGVCFTTEMGLERPVKYRADATEVALRAGLSVIEKKYGGEGT